ncbi:hypothetical protein ACLB9X_09045 [Streptomyces sp. 5K101]|uniref:hypothetical protein n=1 Tax=Streptomyces sp. 5K101 TaxID=3390037 RepID=UPI0039748D6E
MSTTPKTDSIETTTALLEAELPRLEEHQQALQKELAVVSERLESVRGALSALNALAATSVPRPRTSEPPAAAPAAVADESPAVTVTEEPAPEPVQESVPQSAPAQETASAAESAGVGGDSDTTETTDAESASPKARKTTGRAKRKAAPKAAAPQASTRRPAKKRSTAKATKTGTKATKAATPTKAAPDEQAMKGRQTAPRKTAAPVAQDSGGLTEQVIAILSGKAGTPLRARDVAQALGRDESAGAINTVRSTLDRLVATSRAHRAGRGLYQAPTG